MQEEQQQESSAHRAGRAAVQEAQNFTRKISGRIAKKAVSSLAKYATEALAENPYSLAVIATIIIVLLLTFLIIYKLSPNSLLNSGENVQTINPPNGSLTNNCNGEYTQNNAKQGNFGDPNCDFQTGSLYTLLQQQDPGYNSLGQAYADIWYYTIAPRESGYDPNAYNGSSASGNGAYGLFQMNPQGQGNDQYDAGNVTWQQQAQNAISYNNQINNAFTYWASRPCSYVCSGDVDYYERLKECLSSGQAMCTAR